MGWIKKGGAASKDNLGGARAYAGIIHTNVAGAITSVTTLANTLPSPPAAWTHAGLGLYQAVWTNGDVVKSVFYPSNVYAVSGGIPVIVAGGFVGAPLDTLSIDIFKTTDGTHIDFAFDINFLVLQWP